MGLVCLGQIRTISTVPDVRACLFRRNEINGFDSFRRREAGPLLSLFRQQSMAKSWSVWKVWLHIISCSSSSFSCRSLACCYVTLYRRCASRWLVLVFAFLLWLSFACFCVVVEFILCNDGIVVTSIFLEAENLLACSQHQIWSRLWWR